MSQVKIKEICNVLEEWAPLKYQEGYDNSGLIVGDPEMEVKGALLSLDCTEDVIQEAIDNGINMVIAHHPIVFSGLKKFNGKNYVERTVIKAIKHDVAIYAIHTNLDNIPHGVNLKIGEKLGLTNLTILAPKSEEENIGSGMIGEFREEMSAEEFLGHVKMNLETGAIRYTNFLKDSVKTVAFCGGSGSFLLEEGKKQKADVFLSSDFKYHQFFDAENDITIVDIGHFEAEQFTKELIYNEVSEKFPKFALHFSGINTNPVNYY